ncbi:MAG: YkvA family protein [Oscillospiraceae bacterium]
MKKAESFDENQAQNELKKGYKKAEILLHDENKLEIFLQKIENKLTIVPIVGNALSYIPVMISMIRSYVRKEYTEIPIGSIISMISALIYFVSPVDIISDFLPVVGYLDDAAVVAACIKLVKSDIDDYKQWRKINKI